MWHRTTSNLKEVTFQDADQNYELLEFSDDIDLKNKMAWIWVTLKIICISKIYFINEFWDACDFNLGLEPFEMDKQIIIDSIIDRLQIKTNLTDMVKQNVCSNRDNIILEVMKMSL